jgi:hypothetical protein
MPEEDTVVLALLVLQTPPMPVADNVMMLPAINEVGPDITPAVTALLTETAKVVLHAPEV